MIAAPYLLGRAGPGRAVIVNDPGGSGATDGGFVEQPVVTTTAAGNTTVKGKTKPGSFGKFVLPLATIAAGRQYTFRYTPHFAQLAQQGKLAMVGFGLKADNDFHIVGLRGDGSTGIHKYKVNGTPPNGWNKDTGHTISDGGAAANGTQAGPNYIRLVTSADGATYKFQTSPDNVTYTDEYTGQTPTPFSNVSGVTTFGLALWFNNADAGPFSIDIDQFADAAAPTYPLDGLPAPTSAMSVDRDLLSTFAGGTKYTTATGVNSAKDQTGNGNHWNQNTTTLQPTISSFGSHSRACLSFDGTDDMLQNANGLGSLLATTDGLVVAVVQVGSITTDSNTPISNNPVFGDNGGYVGVGLRSTGPNAEAFNFNGSSYNKQTAGFSTGSVHVVMWRHTGGTLYISVDGGAEASVASGNTSNYTGVSMTLGKNAGSSYAAIKLAEIATWNGTMPNPTQLAAYIADCVARYS
ncbi:hypothetical protein EN829_015105 [Mesorhizobium sp. M00.F.Ca.ET.186.01.1.1]|nr:hypothetical protein EN848_14330 [bacterium M00.F.Ca.ET.205.01.1.1]TGU53009.1 hypothetical protein EN795_15065 [bacterium M00.F.Ca.ET.152.01.1.1]TGV35978.1 hypothetical protein EN829_015105 [Mesorhizobium sp. M00.F.Ca.ET.186.01.1.1]TGZ43561.1 hypothetical protein EN805_10675 [bacterium M00.F.Ca.ET.162.01.1.1]